LRSALRKEKRDTRRRFFCKLLNHSAAAGWLFQQPPKAVAAKANAAPEKAIKSAKDAGLEPPDLEPLEAEEMPHRGLARKANGTPTAKTQRIFTDADSHLMKSDGHYIQGYNCQLAVDSDHQVIVALGVSNQAPDVEHLEPMLQRIGARAGAMPDVMTADAGYWIEYNTKSCA
jgi:hypothetical protein